MKPPNEIPPPPPLPNDERTAPSALEQLTADQLAYQQAFHLATAETLKEIDKLKNWAVSSLAARLGKLDGEADILRRILNERKPNEDDDA